MDPVLVLRRWSATASEAEKFSATFSTWQSAAQCAQEVCDALIQLPSVPKCDFPDSLLADLQTVITTVLIAALKRLPPADKAQGLDHPFWVDHCIPMFDACLFSTGWHQMVLDLDKSPKKEYYAKIQTAFRDALKALLDILADLLPNPQDSLALSTPQIHSSILCVMERVLNLAHTAAETIGWRDPRAEKIKTIRSYSLLNMLWLSIARLWSYPSIQSQLQRQEGVSSCEDVVTRLATYLTHDVNMLCRRREPADVKLLQFWLMLQGKLLTACPDLAGLVWKVTLEWGVTARQTVKSLEVQAEGTNPATISLLQAIEKGSIWSRAGRLMVQALCAMPPDQAATTIKDMQHALSEQIEEDTIANEEVACAVLDLLSHGASMTPQVQCLCVPLIPALMTWSMHVLATQEICSAAVDAVIAFTVASFKTGASKENPNVGSTSAMQAASSSSSSWLQLQCALLEVCAMPHPVTAHILRRVWLCMGTLCDVPTAEQLLNALFQILTVVTAQEVAVKGHYVSSDLVEQLVGCIAAVASTAPLPAVNSFMSRNLKLCPLRTEDLCYLACYTATLRMFALVTSSRQAPSTTTLSSITSSFNQLGNIVRRCVAAVLKGAHGEEGLSTLLAWGSDCAAAAVQCLAKQNAGIESMLPEIHSLVSSLVDLLQYTSSSLGNTQSLPLYVVPAVSLLNTVWAVQGGNVLHPTHLKALLPTLTGLAQNATALAVVAPLASAYTSASAPPTVLFTKLLTASDPVVQHIGMEAYMRYIEHCDPGAHMAVLPPAMIDPSTRNLTAEAQHKVTHYIQRTALPTTPLKDDEDEERNRLRTALWSRKLHGKAVSAVHALHAAPRKKLAVKTFPCSESMEQMKEKVREENQAFTLESAVYEVRDAVSRTEEALVALEKRMNCAGPEQEKGVVGPQVIDVLRNCSARLKKLVETHSLPYSTESEM